MARIRSDLQIEKGLPAGNKVLAKPDGQTEVVQIEPYKVSPTTWAVDSDSIYENTPGQFEIPSLPYAKDVDTAISDDGKIYRYNSAGYFTLWIDFADLLGNLFTDDLTLDENREHNLDGNTLKFTTPGYGLAVELNPASTSIIFNVQDNDSQGSLNFSPNQAALIIVKIPSYTEYGIYVTRFGSSVGIRIQTDQPSMKDSEKYLQRIDGAGNVEYRAINIPEYASDTDADNDTELVSGAPYALVGDRTVYRKP